VAGIPGSSTYAAELGFTSELAEAAGRLLIERYERIERIDYKSARDVVTEVDHLSEELIIAAIRGRYPDDAILAEESGSHAGRGGSSTPEPLPMGRVWVIDPLDGTVNYATGIPFFCVSIGLVVDGQSVAGVVLDPTRGDLFAATADGPATLNGLAIGASTKDRLSDFVISLALSGRSVTSRVRALRKQIRISRSMGSAALALAYVGNGRFDAFVQESGLSAWDIAAAGLIAERAGALVTAMDGGPWLDPRRGPRAAGIVAAPGGHHPRILEVARTRS
jgi:myo-inositol-1(or 4)-monophosphatase